MRRALFVDETPSAAEQQQQHSLLGETLKVMVNVVGMMLIGAWLQMSGRLDKDSSRGLSAYVGTIALPALFFKALAEENLFEADPTIVAALVLGKSVMLSVSVLGGWWAKMRTVDPPGLRELRCGMFAMLTTNGDELGLGIPMVSAIFPTMVPMLFVLASIQKFFFLPLELVLLGVGKQLKAADEAAAKKRKDGGKGSGAPTPPPDVMRILGSVMAHKAREPLVIAIACGLLYNLIGPPAAHNPLWKDKAIDAYRPSLMGGASLPSYVVLIASRLGDAFGPVIFVLTGAASVGTFSALASYYVLVMPVTLVLLKSVVLPALLYSFAATLGASTAACDFAFVVGLFPAAGSSMVICKDAGINERQQLIMMATLSLGKVVSFPLLLLATPMLSQSAADAAQLLETVDTTLQSVSLALCAWFLLLCVLYTPHAQLSHGKRSATVALIAFQGLLLLSHLIFGDGCTRAGFCQSDVVWPPSRDSFTDVLHWATEVALLCMAALHLTHLRSKRAEAEGTNTGKEDEGEEEEEGEEEAVGEEDRSLLRQLFLPPSLTSLPSSTSSSSEASSVGASSTTALLDASSSATASAEVRMAARLSDEGDEAYRYARLEDDQATPAPAARSSSAPSSSSSSASWNFTHESHLKVVALVAPVVGVALTVLTGRMTTLDLLTSRQQQLLHVALDLTLAVFDFYGFVQLLKVFVMGGGAKDLFDKPSPQHKEGSVHRDAAAMPEDLALVGVHRAATAPARHSTITSAPGSSRKQAMPYNPWLKHQGTADGRSFGEGYAAFIQRLKVLLVVNAVQLVLSALLIACTSEEGPGPHGSLAVLALLVVSFRSGRGVLLFVLFGWSLASQQVETAWVSLVPTREEQETDGNGKRARRDAIDQGTRMFSLGM